MANLTASSQAPINAGSGRVNRALQWWLFELGETLRLCTRFKRKRMLEFELSSDAVPVLTHAVKRNKIGGRKNVSLKLDAKAFLYRKIKLPVAAHKNIERVIRYEFNKYFPMNAEDALFSYKVLEAKASAASIEVEIWAIGKTLIDSYLWIIRWRYAIEIKLLAITNAAGRVLITRDIEKARRIESGMENAGPKKVLNMVIALLLLALLIYPVYRMDIYLEQQRQEVALLERQSQPIIEIRAKIQALVKRFKDLVDRKQVNPDQAYLWSFITRSVIDKAILNRMQIRGRNVQITGKASSVEKLIRHLESDKRVADVKIIGPVKSTDDNRFETLNLTLMVSG